MPVCSLHHNGFLHKFVALLLAVILLLISGCGGGDNNNKNTSTETNPPPTETHTSSQQPAEISSLLEKMTVMVSVTDAEGTPIAGAMVGDSETTGKDGVLMGAVEPAASGWFRIDAQGYAQEYIKPSTSYHNKAIIAARLTPVDIMESWSPDLATAVTFTIGDTESPKLSIALGANAFNSNITLSATVLDPLLSHTTLADLDTTEPLYISHPFEIRALDMNGNDQQPASGETLQVTITENGDMGAVPRLFWFNPETGIWQEQTDAGCNRLNDTQVQCHISHLSLYGGASNGSPPTATYSDPYSASRNTDQAYKEWTENGDPDNMSDALLDALAAEMDATISWANSHPGEEAKIRLINTLARLELLGFDTYSYVDKNGKNRSSSEVLDAMKSVMEKMAKPHLDDPQCFNFQIIEHLIAQAIFLQFDSIAEPLKAVFQQLVDECNVIQGRIEYSIVLPSDKGWPSLGHYSSIPREVGTSYWTEFHDINLSIHLVDTGNTEAVRLDGTDMVETSFPPVTYRKDINAPDCSFQVYETESFWGDPDKGQVEVTIQADADYNGSQYSNEVLTAAAAITVQYKFFEIGFAYAGDFMNPVCVKDDNITGIVPWWKNYQGQLMEQYKESQFDENNLAFLNSAGKRLPSLWDILNQPPDFNLPGSKDAFPTAIWRGDKVLDDDVMLISGEHGTKVIMRWDIRHIDYTKGKWASLHQ